MSTRQVQNSLKSGLLIGLTVMGFGCATGLGDRRVTSPSDKLFVTIVGENTLVAVDSHIDLKTAEIPVGGEAHDVICSADGKQAYVTGPKSDDLRVVDTATDRVVKTISFGAGSLPWHVEVSNDGQKVFVALQDANVVKVISTSNFAISEVSVLTGHPEPWAIVAPKGTTKVYVTLNGSIARGTANTGTTVGVFDSAAAAPTMTAIALGPKTGPHGIISAPDGSAVYVAAQLSHEVWTIDVATDTATLLTAIPGTAVPNPGFPTDLTITPDGATLIAVNHDIHSITFIKTSDGSIIETVSTGTGSLPWGGIVSPDGNRVFVSTNGRTTISVFDVKTRKETKTIEVGQGPDGFAWCQQ